MNYWIAKANPAKNDTPLMEWILPGIDTRWHAYRIPKKLTKGDRVLLWQSGRGLRVVALGEVKRVFLERDENGDRNLTIRSLTDMIEHGPDIETLRAVPLFNGASFLKEGAAGTLFPLTPDQGRWIFRALVQKRAEVLSLWPDLAGEEKIPDAEEAVLEARPIFTAHFRRERSAEIVTKKKSEFIAKHGRLFCEACKSDYSSLYGESASGVFEVHHKLPLASAADDGVETTLQDLAVLCSNCHRVIHRQNPIISVEQLSKRLQSSAQNSSKDSRTPTLVFGP